MGWEFDGDEDAFNEYCNQYTPSENYETPYWEKEYESFRSSFFTQLLIGDKLKNEKCLNIHVDNERKNVLEIVDFVKDVYRICYLNIDGQKIDNLAPYYNAIRRNNNEAYEYRMLLIQQRKRLMNSEKYSRYLKLIQKRKTIQEYFGQKDTYLDKADPFIDMQKKLANLNGYQNDLILLFIISTAYKAIEYESEYNWKFEYELLDLTTQFSDISFTSKDNPFSNFKDSMTSTTKSITYFKALMERLEKVYEYMILENRINGNNIKIAINEDTISFIDNKYHISLVVTNNNSNNDCFNVKFFDDNILIFSINLTLDLIPFNYSKSDFEKQKIGKQKEDAILRTDFSYSAMIEKGKSLIQRFCKE